MKSNHIRGRSITNDSAVLSLFQSINNMHPQLLDILNQLDEKRCECWTEWLCVCLKIFLYIEFWIVLLSLPVYYEGLQDKLAQVRDARAALNALRDEHREKLRRAAEEAERQRQIQLAQKLEIMRQKKQVIKWGLLVKMQIDIQSPTHVFVLKNTGIPGDAKTVGYSASPGAGEREADATGAAETYDPNESSDACFFSALCPGIHCISKWFQEYWQSVLSLVINGK